MTQAVKAMPLTVREAKWIDRLNRVLASCPSERLGFYTTGDKDVSIYDLRFDPQIDEAMSTSNADFAPTVDDVGAGLGSLTFPSNVHATAA